MSATAQPKKINSFAEMEAARLNAQAAAVPKDWTDEAVVLTKVQRAMNIPPHAMPAAGKTILVCLGIHGLVESHATEPRRTEYRRVPNAPPVKPRSPEDQLATLRQAEERAAAEERRMLDAEFSGERYENPARKEFERALNEVVPGIVEGVLRRHGLIE